MLTTHRPRYDLAREPSTPERTASLRHPTHPTHTSSQPLRILLAILLLPALTLAQETPKPKAPKEKTRTVPKKPVPPFDIAIVGPALAGNAEAMQLLRAQPPSVFPQMKSNVEGASPEAQRRVTGLIRHWVVRAIDQSLIEEAGLIYHGQFAALKPLGPRGARELLQILKQEDAAPEKRRRASIAIGDIGDRSLVPELQKIMDDFLSEDWVIDITGYLMARLGDRTHVDARIADAQKSTGFPPTPRYLPTLIAAHTELAQLYYRTEDYETAIEHYRKKLE